MRVAKISLGLPAANVAPVVTSTAINFPSSVTKKISLPSPRHLAEIPPSREILHFAPGPRKGWTYTSWRPDSSE